MASSVAAARSAATAAVGAAVTGLRRCSSLAVLARHDPTAIAVRDGAGAHSYGAVLARAGGLAEALR
jgi:hypothetical protein